MLVKLIKHKQVVIGDGIQRDTFVKGGNECATLIDFVLNKSGLMCDWTRVQVQIHWL